MSTNDPTKEFLDAYDTLSDPLFRHCFVRIRDRERARDIVQETFIKTWEYLARGKRIENLKAFLYKVAVNLVIDHARKHKEASLDQLMEDGFDAGTAEHAHLPISIEARQMLRVIDTLDPKYRDPIVLRYVDDLSPKDIAAVMGETENTISVRIHRGIHQVREILKNNNNG